MEKGRSDDRGKPRDRNGAAMLMDLLATLSAGFGGAGLALILRWLLRLGSRRTVARWAVPAGAGAGMICYAIWAEYSWFDRVKAELPPEVKVVLALPQGAPWRPWSYVFPVTTRFVALDARAPLTHAAVPGQVVMPVLFVARWQPLRSVPVAFDCPGRRRADIGPEATIDSDGRITGTEWLAVPPGDPIFAAACNGG